MIIGRCLGVADATYPFGVASFSYLDIDAFAGLVQTCDDVDEAWEVVTLVQDRDQTHGNETQKMNRLPSWRRQTWQPTARIWRPGQQVGVVTNVTLLPVSRLWWCSPRSCRICLIRVCRARRATSIATICGYWAARSSVTSMRPQSSESYRLHS